MLGLIIFIIMLVVVGGGFYMIIKSLHHDKKVTQAAFEKMKERFDSEDRSWGAREPSTSEIKRQRELQQQLDAEKADFFREWEGREVLSFNEVDYLKKKMKNDNS